MLVLPESLREEVRKPFGEVLTGSKLKKTLALAAKPIISVGDQCTHDLISAGAVPDIFIIDFKIKRVEIPLGMKKTFAQHAANAYMVLSPPGAITDELVDAVDTVLDEEKGAVIVVGEDDLSALLVMARADGGTLVYGQPNEGAVVVPLGDEKTRKKAQDVLDKMEEK